jgi:hypothetical protein
VCQSDPATVIPLTLGTATTLNVLGKTRTATDYATYTINLRASASPWYIYTIDDCGASKESYLQVDRLAVSTLNCGLAEVIEIDILGLTVTTIRVSSVVRWGRPEPFILVICTLEEGKRKTEKEGQEEKTREQEENGKSSR